MGYSRNLDLITIDDFKEILVNRYLIPSMRVLLSDIDRRFDLLVQHNIINVEDLYQQTKTKKKVAHLVEVTGIDIDYMIVLRRLVSSYIAKPRKLNEYPDIDIVLCKKLEEMNIKTSKILYDYLESEDREQILSTLAIDSKQLKCLEALMEVTRLRYVSPLFATVLVRSGYDSIEKIAAGDSKLLHEAILTTNKEQHIYKGNVGDSDAQFLIDDAVVFMKYR